MSRNKTEKKWQYSIQLYVGQTIVLGCLLLLAARYIRWWPFELIVTALPQLAIAAATLTIVLFTLYIRSFTRDGMITFKSSVNRPEMAVALSALILVVVLFVDSMTPITPLDIKAADGPTITVATFNKLYTNHDIASAQAFFERVQPDVLVMQEVNEAEAQQIGDAVQLPYLFSSDCNCSAGDSEVIMLSRYPLENAVAIYKRPVGTIIRADIVSSEGQFSVFAVHVPPPYTPSGFAQRADMLKYLSLEVVANEYPTFVMGDFNMTVFSPDFSDFYRPLDDKLQYAATRNWPRCSWYGLSSLACLRIDHIFIPTGSRLRDFSIGGAIGSDHRPLVATLQLPSTEASLR